MGAATGSTTRGWTRREFVRGAAGAMALTPLRHGLVFGIDGLQEGQIAYVASLSIGGNGWGAIHAFASPAGKQPNTWSQRQQVASRAPAALLLSQQVLYVANQVSLHQGVPRGTIEAFRVEPGSGTLTLLGRTPLSLAATRPRHMALSPDGKLLAVAAYGGGIYNLLPVGKDGSLGAPCGIFKDTGCGPHWQLQTSAHPHTLLFDSIGKHLLCSDFGSDRISVFAVADGRLTRVSQVATAAGGGPSQFVLHPAGFLYVSHSLANTIGCYQYDESSGTVTERPPLLPAVTVAGAGSLALHPAGHTLYATDEPRGLLRLWHVDAYSGALLPKGDVPLGTTAPSHVSVARDGQSIYILDSRNGAMVRLVTDGVTGEVRKPSISITIPAPASLALVPV